jgi:hypothetical protein
LITAISTLVRKFFLALSPRNDIDFSIIEIG